MPQLVRVASTTGSSLHRRNRSNNANNDLYDRPIGALLVFLLFSSAFVFFGLVILERARRHEYYSAATSRDSDGWCDTISTNDILFALRLQPTSDRTASASSSNLPYCWGSLSPDDLQSIEIVDYPWMARIPTELGLLSSSITSLILYSNAHLTGTIPTELGLLTNLTHLSIRNNPKLTGTIPLEVFTGLPNLQTLDLSGNDLSGGLPSIPPMVPSLTQLRVQQNRLSGTIPRDLLMQLPNLQGLRLSHNLFSGPLESIFLLQQDENKVSNHPEAEHADHCQYLQFFDATANSLTGTLPSTLVSSCPALTALYLGHNALHGPLPPQLLSSPSLLQELDLAANDAITGTLPETLFCGRSALQYLVLAWNQMSGTLPSACASIGGGDNNRTDNDLGSFNLAWVDLHSNHFTGTVAVEFRTMVETGVLNVEENDGLELGW